MTLILASQKKSDIIEVEKRFFELSSAGNLTVISINNFIQVTRDFCSAGSYVDGLSMYLYGVLAKDQRGDTSLSREEGRARLTSAQQLLARFDTPLSAVINQTINFNLNAFNDGLSLQNSPRLGQVMQRFWRLHWISRILARRRRRLKMRLLRCQSMTKAPSFCARTSVRMPKTLLVYQVKWLARCLAASTLIEI